MGQKFSRDKLARYIVDSNKSGDDLAREVAALLVDYGRSNELDSIMRDVMELEATKNGVVEVTAICAFPLSQTTRSEIEAYASKVYNGVKKVIIHETIDKSVIGGVRLSFANADLDLTIRSKLNKLREAVT